MKIHVWKLVGAVALCEFAGIAGAFYTSPAVSSSWYTGLVKPVLQPPAWLFSPVWTTLYALMGIALYLVWVKGGVSHYTKSLAIKLFFLQLLLNVLWSIFFFGAREIGLALADLALLWFAILATIANFARVSRVAAWLLVPYILWVSFAVYLNYSLWILN